MSEQYQPPSPLEEPPIHNEDTPPSGTIAFRREATQPVKVQWTKPRTSGGRLNAILYGIAALITAGAALLYLQSSTTLSVPIVTSTTIILEETPETTTAPLIEPTAMPTLPAATMSSLADGNVDTDVVAEALLESGDTAPPIDALLRMRSAYTIAPVRPRSTWIKYIIRQGDDLDGIAKQFGITTDTIAWSNDITFVNRLFPGDPLTILPEDGVLHKTNGQETIQQIGEKYKVTAYRIIDSEYNPKLTNATPETILPEGMQVMVPGGVSEKKLLFWQPEVKESTSDGQSGGNRTVSFEGGAGSCSAQYSGNSTGTLINPLPIGAYTITRTYTSAHSGIDMAGRAGTTVFAADAGTVIFAGWSSYGYGNTVVIMHNDKMTLYGHLSAISVSCGQSVSQGQPIAATGSTGRSSGPHLHFEVRPSSTNYTPVNPLGYVGL